ncbi:hypothetical protein AB0K48_53490, partial [Nonomuraea sp. NPDC055795]
LQQQETPSGSPGRTGLPPESELLDLVYAHYPQVYLIDELHNTLVPCERAYFDRPDAVGLYRSNVVAAGRPEHLDVLRPHLAPT